jgi:hypothetical protein
MKIKAVKLLVTRLESLLDSPQAPQFNMHHFGAVYSKDMLGSLPDIEPVCHTQACLAGETVLAHGTGVIDPEGGIEILPRGSLSWSSSIETQAAKDLGLTPDERRKLFYFKEWNKISRQGWPVKFQAMYEAAKTPQGRLYAAIRRVEHFIKTGN